MDGQSGLEGFLSQWQEEIEQEIEQGIALLYAGRLYISRSVDPYTGKAKKTALGKHEHAGASSTSSASASGEEHSSKRPLISDSNDPAPLLVLPMGANCRTEATPTDGGSDTGVHRQRSECFVDMLIADLV